MDVSTYVTALREDLAAAAAAADEQARRTAALLGAAIEPAARLAIMNALSDLAAEVTSALGDRVVEVRLDGRDVRVSVSEPPTDDTDGEPSNSAFGGRDFAGADLGGDISRMTVRLVEQMKAQAEKAAAAQGMSLNAWVSQAVQGALGKPGRGGHPRGDDWSPPGSSRRVRGWAEG